VRRYRVPLVLIVIVLGVLGAFLHPLALLLALIPTNTAPVIAFLERTREAIADVLGWGIVGLVLVMLAYVLAGRRARPAGGAQAAPLPISAEPSVAVAITAYNDAAATAQAARDFRRLSNVTKVIVVDNNSTDDTSTLARQAGAEVVNEPQQGYGHACIRGLAEGVKSGADVVVLTEGDGTFFADDLPKFLAYIRDADLVVGNRVVRGLVAADSQMDHFFTWGNMAVAMLLRLRFWDGRHLGPAGLSDVGCTYRAIRRPALERILPDLRVGGNAFSPHMLMVAMARDLVVVEIPVRLRPRIGRSKGASQSLLSGVQVGLAMIWDILTFNLPERPQRSGIEPEPAQLTEKAGAAR
jgi:cellulose synthase/poly-beta-1,6-N-acetylglucosamine synthase-like glycosyltransferase